MSLAKINEINELKNRYKAIGGEIKIIEYNLLGLDCIRARAHQDIYPLKKKLHKDIYLDYINEKTTLDNIIEIINNIKLAEDKAAKLLSTELSLESDIKNLKNSQADILSLITKEINILVGYLELRI